MVFGCSFIIQRWVLATDLWLSIGQLHQYFWLSGDFFWLSWAHGQPKFHWPLLSSKKADIHLLFYTYTKLIPHFWRDCFYFQNHKWLLERKGNSNITLLLINIETHTQTHPPHTPHPHPPPHTQKSKSKSQSIPILL